MPPHGGFPLERRGADAIPEPVQDVLWRCGAAEARRRDGAAVRDPLPLGVSPMAVIEAPCWFKRRPFDAVAR